MNEINEYWIFFHHILMFGMPVTGSDKPQSNNGTIRFSKSDFVYHGINWNIEIDVHQSIERPTQSPY